MTSDPIFILMLKVSSEMVEKVKNDLEEKQNKLPGRLPYYGIKDRDELFQEFELELEKAEIAWLQAKDLMDRVNKGEVTGGSEENRAEGERYLEKARVDFEKAKVLCERLKLVIIKYFDTGCLDTGYFGTEYFAKSFKPLISSVLKNENFTVTFDPLSYFIDNIHPLKINDYINKINALVGLNNIASKKGNTIRIMDCPEIQFLIEKKKTDPVQAIPTHYESVWSGRMLRVTSMNAEMKDESDGDFLKKARRLLFDYSKGMGRCASFKRFFWTGIRHHHAEVNKIIRRIEGVTVDNEPPIQTKDALLAALNKIQLKNPTKGALARRIQFIAMKAWAKDQDRNQAEVAADKKISGYTPRT
ncbi:MAG: DUF5617 domain-containing protein [Gammaproteobacteria bacterium]|nr:DUF5617 domain-containing protein [Gammaproteobacteria bacterium]